MGTTNQNLGGITGAEIESTDNPYIRPPVGYIRLAEGLSCACNALFTAPDGRKWCCGDLHPKKGRKWQPETHVAGPGVINDGTENIDWGKMDEVRLGQRPRDTAPSLSEKLASAGAAMSAALGDTPPSAVDHPPHYGGADNPYEVIKVLEAWLTRDEMIGALKFQIHCYLARSRRKNGAEDHAKALWYTNFMVEYEKKHPPVDKPVNQLPLLDIKLTNVLALLEDAKRDLRPTHNSTFNTIIDYVTEIVAEVRS